MRRRDTPGQTPTRHVAVVAFPGAQVLDVTGPLEVFARSARCLAESRRSEPSAYTIEVLAAEAGPLPTFSAEERRSA
jgi:hypothetical protein